MRLKDSDLVFAMLPGSRQSELDYHAGVFLETAKRLNKDFPNAKFLVPLTTRETREQFEAAKWKCGAQELPMQVLFGHANFALAAADAAVIASGTATLEAAMLRCPHVIAYRLSNATYRLMKRKAYLPWVGSQHSGQRVVGAGVVATRSHAGKSGACVWATGFAIPRRPKRCVSASMPFMRALAVNNAERVCDALALFIERRAAQGCVG